MSSRKKTLDEIAASRDEYDPESQQLVDSMRFLDREVSEINSMKRTAGWKVLDKKIREELHMRIAEKVKDDLKIQTLLGLLTVADTKDQEKMLDEEIGKILP